MSFLVQWAFLLTAMQSEPSSLVYVLDASGSMWGQLSGKAKIEWAREALIQSLGKLPQQQRFALYVYGHREESNCNDIEMVVPAGPLQIDQIQTVLAKIKPKGKTPLHNALKTCFSALAESGNPATVVLISDGLETCDGDACELTRQAFGTGKVRVHVVGFDVSKQDQGLSALECIAQAGGGTYFDASDGEQLGQALELANQADINRASAQLQVEARNNGELMDVAVQVFNQGQQIASARTYTSASTNPRTLHLEPDTYQVKVTPIGLRGATPRQYEGIEVSTDQPYQLVVDFSSGMLRVKTETNGSPTDCAVLLLEPGGKKTIASRRTYRNAEPIEMEVPPGLYDLEIKSLTIEGAALIEEKSIQIQPGQVLERSFSFDSGLCEVRTRFESNLVDCIVAILPRGANKAIAQARSYAHEKTNPVKFVVPPGAYTVKVTPIDRKNYAVETHDLTVPKGERISWDCILAKP